MYIRCFGSGVEKGDAETGGVGGKYYLELACLRCETVSYKFACLDGAIFSF